MVNYFNPATSACVIAGLELKFPDSEEKKNSILTIKWPPQMPVDLFNVVRVSGKANLELIQALGLGFQTNRRLFYFAHLGYIELMKVMYFILWKGEAFENKDLTKV